jgi:hypothetical protein
MDQNYTVHIGPCPHAANYWQVVWYRDDGMVQYYYDGWEECQKRAKYPPEPYDIAWEIELMA